VERLGDRTFRIVLTQGLNRQIRRMCRALGHEVRTLKRIRIVNIELGALKPGQQRRIEGDELQELYKTVMTQDAGKNRKMNKRQVPGNR
jgi:23S rRNA pseudouridine2604 synthase